MPRLLIPLILVSVGVMIYALIEAISTPSEKTRIMPKGVWIVVILLVPLVGGVLWLLFGNENAYLAATVEGFKRAQNEPQRPQNPDDDDEFLRSLDIQRAQRRKDEELKKREEELRRREEELDDDSNSNDSDSDSDEDQSPT